MTALKFRAAIKPLNRSNHMTYTYRVCATQMNLITYQTEGDGIVIGHYKTLAEAETIFATESTARPDWSVTLQELETPEPYEPQGYTAIRSSWGDRLAAMLASGWQIGSPWNGDK
jgi:hypothetical protein